MPRLPRPNQPGGIFHLTARTLKGQRLFTPPARTEILRLLLQVIPASETRLLAVAIMPNHLHLVVQQGGQRLSRLMQPFLQRIVYLLHRRGSVRGPVFWRPYGCAPCLDPGHARNAIVYTHLNPVRAGICDDPADYAWSSHLLYARDAAATPSVPRATAIVAPVLDPGHALPLFAARAERSTAELRHDYLDYLMWRLAVDHWDDEEEPAPPAPRGLGTLPAAWAQLRWSQELTPLFHAPADRRPGGSLPAARPDLADVARTALAAESVGIPLSLLRGRRGGREYARLRRLIIRRAHVAGYQNAAIARFLCVSESAVSKVVCSDPD